MKLEGSHHVTAITADARVQDAGELTRWVVAHDQAHVVAALLECRRLQLRMLDDRAPERPREGNHDSDLHSPGESMVAGR